MDMDKWSGFPLRWTGSKKQNNLDAVPLSYPPHCTGPLHHGTQGVPMLEKLLFGLQGIVIELQRCNMTYNPHSHLASKASSLKSGVAT
eukprot:1161900-Pelagomonas_calceolata.AAC.14